MDHHQSCDHSSHTHALGHVHAPSTFGAAFAFGALLNGGFVAAEVVYGFRSNSMALLSDAGHNLGDVLGLLAAWGAAAIATRAPTDTHTYGYRMSPIFAALLNGAILLLSTGAIICESIRRIFQPSPVVGNTVMAVAAIGIAINLGTALMFAAGSRNDLNARGAFIHMLGDAAVALGVVIAGFALRQTGILLIDPLVSIVVAVVVLLASWKLLRQASTIAMNGVPESVSLPDVKKYLSSLAEISNVHDLHIWSMSASEIALTVHLVAPGGVDQGFVTRVARDLKKGFRIDHSTIQVESGDAESCRLACELSQSLEAG